jgi:multiple sugar transport system ATP-binding protein
MASIKLKSITKTFKDITAVKEIDLEIKDKEFFILLGPTGAGKTTTLRLVAGLEKQDKGEILLDNKNVSDIGPALRDVAFVFQYYTLYPNYTVKQNLEFPLKSKLRRLPRKEIDKKVSEVSKILHIEHLLGRNTVNLSGGEMQRVAIGRAIVRTPKVFLMDEPLSNLDAKLREEMRVELARIHLDLNSTFFYVTHDQIEAMTMADRIAVLNEGEIIQIGTPKEIYKTPENVFVAEFIGSPEINLFNAAIEDNKLIINERAMVYSMTDEQHRLISKYNRKNIIVGVRPEDIEITREKGSVNSFKSTDCIF